MIFLKHVDLLLKEKLSPFDEIKKYDVFGEEMKNLNPKLLSQNHLLVILKKNVQKDVLNF